MDKLGASTRAQAVAIAFADGRIVRHGGLLAARPRSAPRAGPSGPTYPKGGTARATRFRGMREAYDLSPWEWGGSGMGEHALPVVWRRRSRRGSRGATSSSRPRAACCVGTPLGAATRRCRARRRSAPRRVRARRAPPPLVNLVALGRGAFK